MSQKVKQDMQIGSTIRNLRKQTGLTQESMVAKLQLRGLSISRSSYSQIECGTYNIRISELVGIKEILGVDFNAIFSEVDKLAKEE